MNKPALVRFTLHETIKQLDLRELLCLLTDMYTGAYEKNHFPRWYGQGGLGSLGMEQGIYHHMVTFRRISDLWAKLSEQLQNEDLVKEEVYAVRNLVIKVLNEKGINTETFEAGETAANV